MTVKKWYSISIIVTVCILLNYAGKAFANHYQLPLWLDSTGTVITAYLLGPACGAIVGASVNIIYGFQHPVSFAYALTNIAIGVIVGLSSRKKRFDTLFGTFTASVLVTLAAVAISTPLNAICASGFTGNLWGDGVIEYLQELHLPKLLCSITGEFYVDFLDKTLTLLVLYIALKCLIKLHRRPTLLPAALLLTGLGMAQAPMNAQSAAFAPREDFNAYVQTVYSSDNGLPCGEANDIVQTSNGILWIGTYAGLYRHNGSEFRWMNEYTSVRSVNCLYVDEEGRLWIGTNDTGLSICIGDKIVNVLDSASGLPSNSVRKIVKGADGFYYIGTSMGMIAVSLNSGLLTHPVNTELGYTASLSADKRGNVAVITSDGKLSILRNRERILFDELASGKEMYNTCAFADDNTLYVGTTENHIYSFELTEHALIKRDERSCGTLSYLNRLYFYRNKLFV